MRSYDRKPYGGNYQFNDERVFFQLTKIFSDCYNIRIKRIKTNVDHEVIVANGAEHDMGTHLTREMIGEKVQIHGELQGRKIKRMILQKLPDKNLEITVIEFR